MIPPVKCDCGITVYVVPMLFGEERTVTAGKIEIISKIRDGIWTTNEGYLPHVCK